jgi:hypothetical protein
MPKGSNSRGSDEDFEFKRKGDDFNFDLDVKGRHRVRQEKKTGRSTSINAAMPPAASSTIHTPPSTTTARNHTVESSPKTQSTTVNSSKGPQRIEADPASKRTKLKMKHRSNQ